jgi:hypothetical protein
MMVKDGIKGSTIRLAHTPEKISICSLTKKNWKTYFSLDNVRKGVSQPVMLDRKPSLNRCTNKKM